MENNLNQLKISIKQKVIFFKNKKLILIPGIILFVGLYCYYINSIIVSSNILAYDTRSIPFVSDDHDELSKLIGFNDRDIYDEIIKTKDSKFLFFTADIKNCSHSMSCSGHSYVINVDKKTISDFKIADVHFHVTPVFGSLVVIEQSGDKKLLVYDSSKNIIIDTMEVHNGEYDSIYDSIDPFSNFLFGSDKYYTYTYKNILYSRDIAKHVSTSIGNFYDPEVNGIRDMKSPSSFSDNGEIFYTLIYVNKDDTRPYSNRPYITPKKDDPLQFIAWNFINNTSKVITTQTFNFPFSFKFLTKNSVLIGAGQSRYGLENDQTYLVDIETGESKIYNASLDSTSTTNIITDHKVPRIMMWGDNVNQHWDLEKGIWLSDPDGISGAQLDKLTYCIKFYPDTISVVSYKNETINTWKAGYDYENYTGTAMSYQCVSKN